MGRQRIGLNPVAADAAIVIGQQVRFARHDENWTVAELADRAGVSAHTVTSIENGSAAVSVGNTLNVLVAAGVPLFGTTASEKLLAIRRNGEEKLAFLPAREHHRGSETIDLDF